jgi:DNA-binding transcriptional regulator LsrR (DeoR family)
MSNGRIPHHQEKQICADYEAGMNASDVARRHGISNTSVGNILKRNGIRTRAPSERHSERDRMIVECYESGATQQEIGERFGLSQTGVGKILDRNGVSADYRLSEEEKERAVSLYLSGATSRQVAEQIGMHYSTVCSLLRSRGIERRSRRKWFFDEGLFLRTDDRAAYWMGFFMADGNVIKAGQTWQFSLTVSEKDRVILELLCRDLKLDTEILRTYRKTTDRGNPQSLVCLSLCHPSIQDWFLRWGIVPRKSYCFVEPTVPIEAYPGFLRGWFDGDGCLSVREKSSSIDVRIAGNREGMAWYAGALERLGFSGSAGLRFHRSDVGACYYLIITGEKDVCSFYELLNARGNLRLDRKWRALEARIESKRLKAQADVDQGMKLVEAYLNGRAERDLARDFRMGTKRVRAILVEAGVEVKQRASPTRLDEECERVIVADYERGLRQAEIAQKFGLTQPRVSSILAKYGVETIPSHVRRMTDEERADEIASWYMNGLSQAEVAEKFGMSVSGVKKVLDRKGVPMRPPVRYRRKSQS